MNDRFSRRRFLAAISAAALPLAACRSRKPVASLSEAPGDYLWTGIGFGIEMSMEIFGVTAPEGERLGSLCEQCIREMEQAFSLYQDDSELSVLNRERILPRPSPLFRGLLETAVRLQGRTFGYYQPAIHGAWLWLEKHGDARDLDGDPEWNELCAASDLRFLEAAADGPVRLTHPLTQLSMNAIAQGFLADQVAGRLRAEGVTSALLHLGESYAIGRHPEGRLWNLAVTGEADVVGHIEFADAGLAVSARDAARLLIDPVARTVGRQARVAAIVSSEGAAVADAFATAFAVAPENQWPRLADALKQAAGSQIRVWVENGLRFTG